MRRREVIFALAGAAAWPLAVHAQQSDRVRRIGVLFPNVEGDPLGQARAAALQQGLEAKGWMIGRNVRIDYRWGADSAENIQVSIAELLALAPDVIVASTSRAVAALQRATRTVPIVFTAIYEPVAQGFVQSLAHPGGNTTGFTNVEATVGAKWVELLKAIAPHLKRIALVFDPNNPGPMQSVRSAEAVAPNHAMQVVRAPAHGPAEIEAAISTFAREPDSGLIVIADGFLVPYRKMIIDLAARYRLPTIYGISYFTAESGLASYGINPLEQTRQIADYVDRILRGEKAGDLPVQQPTKYELIINLKTAKVLGLEVPPTVLGRADEVIE
jgi:putative ABC transport system substrate-binding protein